DERENRAEDLFLRDRHVASNVREDGRAHEVATLRALRRLVAAGDNARALLDAFPDVTAHPLTLDVGDQGPELRLLVERVAHRIGVGDRGGDPLSLLEAGAGHQHARERATRLA